MAQLDLYIDTHSRTLVSGPSNTAAFQFPGFTQGDTISLRIYLLARNTTFPFSPYSIINNADLSLRVGIGDKNGTAGTTPIAAQYTWSKDAANQYFYADLALNTAEVTTAIGSAASIDTKWFEVEYAQAGKKTTVLQQKITLHADVVEEVAAAPVPGLTTLTLEEAVATFAKLYGAVGETQTFRSPDGTKGRIIGVDNDGNRIDEVVAL